MGEVEGRNGKRRRDAILFELKTHQCDNAGHTV